MMVWGSLLSCVQQSCIHQLLLLLQHAPPPTALAHAAVRGALRPWAFAAAHVPAGGALTKALGSAAGESSDQQQHVTHERGGSGAPQEQQDPTAGAGSALTEQQLSQLFDADLQQRLTAAAAACSTAPQDCAADTPPQQPGGDDSGARQQPAAAPARAAHSAWLAGPSTTSSSSSSSSTVPWRWRAASEVPADPWAPLPDPTLAR
jgi:hypothetical protein